MKSNHALSSRLFLSVSVVTLLISFSSFAAPDPVLTKKNPPQKIVTDIFSVTKWGRYAIAATSQEGSAVQLVDRKSGFRKRDGVPGEKNGRIDEFLDIGEYKVVSSPHQDGKSETVVKVTPFTEINSASPQYMVLEREYSLSLRDYEQASWWLYCERDTTLYIEAIGRNVADVQLWLNGEWRVDAQRTPIDAAPIPETPLKGLRVVQQVKAGYYLCTVYGGAEAGWSKNSEKHPLYVRAGVPRLPVTGYRTVTISSKGYNTYYAASDLQAVVAERETKKRTYLEVLSFPVSAPSAHVLANDSITEKSSEARCILFTNASGNQGYLIHIAGKPGDVVALQTFGQLRQSINVSESGDYWFSTFNSGYPDDQIGASGIVVNTTDKNSIIGETVEYIGEKNGVSRTFNLTATVSLIIKVETEGKYEFIPSGTAMNVTVVRLITGGGVTALPSFSEKTSMQLEPGYYTVTLSPGSKGIATLQIHKSSVVQMIKNAVGARGALVHGYRNVQFPSLALDHRKSYSFFSSKLSPEITGSIFRKLPLALDEALTVFVDSGSDISVPVLVKERSMLTVADASGKTYPCKINGTARKTPCEVDAGTLQLVLFLDHANMVSAVTTPVRNLPQTPPQPFPAGTESPLPQFPVLKPGTVAWLDLKRDAAAVYEFTVDKPGMYRFETLGRLHTSLTLRDRFVVNALTADANGTGRNALIQTYLLPGTYQTKVATINRSTGRLGLSLTPNETIDGGKLTTQKEKKHEVPSGDGISYTVEINEKAMYELSSQGQSGYFNVRFDDNEGWPVVQPFGAGNIAMELSAGTYHLISVPQQRTTLRTARLVQKELAPVYTGKGPHTLPLNRTASSIWMEDSAAAAGTVRKPARYSIDIPAPARFRLSVTKGFTAVLCKKSAGDTVVKWTGTIDTVIPAGNFTCSLQPDEAQNNLPYSLSVSTATLMKGQSAVVGENNRSLQVSVGKPGVYELFSQGTADVTARLLLGKKVVAENDDAPFDWNFRITRMLMPGTYTLLVGHASNGRVATTVAMAALEDTVYTGWESGVEKSIDMGGKLQRIVAAIGNDQNILHVAVKGGAPVSCQVQRIGSNGTEVSCGIAEGKEIAFSMPVDKGNKYAVYFWSVDHADEMVTVSVRAATALPVTLSEMQRGKKCERIGDGNGYHVWLKMDMGSDSLGQFVVDGGDAFTGVTTSHALNRACKPDVDRGFVTLRRIRWITLSYSEGGGKKVSIDHIPVEQPVRVPLEKYPRAFRIPSKKGELSVIAAEVKVGRPMCGVVADRTGKGLMFPNEIAVHAGVEYKNGTVLGVDLPGDPHLFMVWDAVAEGGTAEKTDCVVSLKRYAIVHEEVLDFGPRVWNAREESACSMNYSGKAPALVTVTIPRGGVALWQRADGSRTTLTTSHVVRQCRFTENEGTLFLVNNGASAQFTIECIALDTLENEPSFTQSNSGLHYEMFMQGAGTHIVALPEGCALRGKTVTYSGAVEKIEWWTRNGTVYPSLRSGSSLMGVSGGFFAVNHAAGWIKIDLCGSEDGSCAWGMDSGEKQGIRAVRYSQSVTLGQGVNWFTISPERETHLRMQAESPMVITLLSGGNIVKTISSFGRSDISLPLVNGTYTIGCRGPGTTSLDKVRLLVSLNPIAELREKSPPELLLAAGESRMFKFTIAKKTKVGIGLETDNEVIDAMLLDAALNEVGRGQQQFIDLDSGEYYLLCAVANNDAPTRCTIRLIGQELPPDTPPEDLINRLMTE